MSSVTKIWKGTMISCLISVIFLMICPLSINAAENSSISIKLPVEQSFNDSTGKQTENVFSYVFKSLEEESPMPEGTQNGKYTFTMKENEEIELPAIIFEKTGFYRYEIRQEINKEKKGYNYDKEVYTVDIYIKNGTEGKLTAEVILYKSNGKKTDKIFFENSYDMKQEKNNTIKIKTGDNTSIASYVGLLLLSFFGILSFWKRH